MILLLYYFEQAPKFYYYVFVLSISKRLSSNHSFQLAKGQEVGKQEPVLKYSGAAYPYVPITRVDTWVLSLVGPSLARPKPETLVLKSCNPRLEPKMSLEYLGEQFRKKNRATKKLCKLTPSKRMATLNISMYDWYFQVMQEGNNRGSYALLPKHKNLHLWASKSTL